MKKKKPSWEVYIIQTTTGHLYTGITTDLNRRFRDHLEGKRGARFFRISDPEKIIYRESHPNRSQATKREIEIKKMNRQQKLDLAHAYSGRSSIVSPLLLSGMRCFGIYFIFLTIALFLNGFSADLAHRAAIRHVESGGIGYEHGYTTLEAFLASDPTRWKAAPFLDVRGHVFDNGKWAANGGVGLRALWRNRVYGVNAYYDYRNTGRFHSNQIGAGLETLGELFDFRINGYLPVGAKLSDGYDASFSRFSGHYMLIAQKVQSAMKGADAEFGFHFGKTESFDFYAAAGPYYFVGELDPTTWGGKARIGGTFKDILALEISDSYDGTFHNKFQGQISLSFALGPKSKENPCKRAGKLHERMVQPVGRQEIIVIDHTKQDTIAINPATGLPYFFVFVDNTSSSNGTYESPYHTLAQAQANSGPNDIIYVFPGNGTTTGMNSGISLQENQKFWGSGVSHSLHTSAGTISIPRQSSTSPIITNTNVDTEGNAITLAANNVISGFTIASAIHDAIYGTNLQSLDVSSCTFQTTTTFPIEATFPANASVSITNNQFLNNVNGVYLTLNGTSTVVCSNNTFRGQTSVSSVPIEISASSNTFTTNIENNVFNSNVTGSIRFSLASVIDADINVLNNTITNNGTGSQASLGSSLVLISTGTIASSSIVLTGNTFSNNTLSGSTSHSLYLHTSGAFTNLSVTASTNTMSSNGGSALILATPANTLTLLATGNTIASCSDNGIAVISSTSSSTGHITISNNTITDITNFSNGIAVNQDFTTLTLTIQDNVINRCHGTGIISYAPVTGIGTFVLDVAGNTISNCENGGGNAASGLNIEQYTNLAASITNNTLSGNTGGPGVVVSSSLSTPTVCLALSGNSSNTSPGYSLVNSGGTFRLSPCNAEEGANTGTISTSGTITHVQSCPAAASCP